MPTKSWQTALLLLVATISWVLFWYWDTARAMVAIWARSDTYAHAFIVPPISLWLIWRKRRELALLQPAPTLWLALPLAALTFFWLLGELTAVNALTQFALVATLIIATISVLGFQVSRHIAFPLAFLLFAVPVGDFMMPKLMEWTAWFTVLALRATGIPVYQEGLQFVIPSGNWSVVEACSGIRYIIASVTVGTLFAYLNYVSPRRRLIFVAVSILVPVVANWLRAYMIVMIGHFSGNKLAVGVDHLIYGWLFFGIVILAMFAIGARWSENPEVNAAASTPLPARPLRTGASWLAVLGLVAIIASGPLGFMAISRADQASPPQLAHLAPPAGWSETPAFVDWKPAYANPSATLRQSFTKGSQQVGLHIAYYRNQDFERKLVTSTNVLVVSNDPVWSVVARNHVALATGEVRSAELRGRQAGIDTRLVVWQWYWINGHLTTSDIEAKLLTALSRLRGRGDDSATVMLFARADGAAPSLTAFAEAAGPQIMQLLAQTRDAR
jgi:exosortase A